MALWPVPSAGSALMLCWMAGSLPNQHASARKGMSFSLEPWPLFARSQAGASAHPFAVKLLLYPSLTARAGFLSSVYPT